MKKAEDVRIKRPHSGFVASSQGFVSAQTDRENKQVYEQALWETRELSDTKKRAETVIVQLKEALLAKEGLENRVKTLETQVRNSEEQVENLQRNLAAIKEVKAKMEKLLGEKTAKETPEVCKGIAK